MSWIDTILRPPDWEHQKSCFVSTSSEWGLEDTATTSRQKTTASSFSSFRMFLAISKFFRFNFSIQNSDHSSRSMGMNSFLELPRLCLAYLSLSDVSECGIMKPADDTIADAAVCSTSCLRSVLTLTLVLLDLQSLSDQIS